MADTSSAADIPLPATGGKNSISLIPEADFDDRLSPMLVKELRQGQRSKTFISVFLSLQGFLVFVLLIAAASAASSSTVNGEPISKVIFFFFGVAALVIQPVRAIGTLHSEIRGNSIELLTLTRLSSWQIVLGKWLSVYSQTALLFIAVAPYLVLRYFFGGMQLFAEIGLLTTLFFASGVLTAIITGISGVASVLVRGLAPLLSCALLLMPISEYVSGDNFGAMVSHFSLSSSGERWAIFGIFAGGAYLAWLFLGMGAAVIAPAAENHSTMRRLITLALILLAAIAGAVGHFPATVLSGVLAAILIPAIILSVSEKFELLPPVCEPFLRGGLPGRLLGRLLYPGWPTGIVFSLLCIGLSAAILCLRKERLSPADQADIWDVTGVILLPAALTCLFGKRQGVSRFPLYLLFLVLAGILPPALIAIARVAPSPDFLWFFSWLPGVGSFLRTLPGVPAAVHYLAPGLAYLYGSIALVAGLWQFGKISQIEEEADRIHHSS